MAELGFRTIDEMIGRADCLDVERAVEPLEGQGPRPRAAAARAGAAGRRSRAAGCASRITGSSVALDNELIGRRSPRSSTARRSSCTPFIRNADRTVGTMLGYEVTKRYGGAGLPDDTIRITFTGSAGQSFGAFVPRGMTLTLVGDANDGFGKGLSGGTADRLSAAAVDVQVGGEHHHRQRRVLRRDERRGLRPRRGGRAVLRAQQRRARSSSKASATTAAST